MADRTMEELLQAPTEGYGEAIVISKILAENFEIKTNLLQLVQANKFHGFERDNPHTHISNFKRMTATLKYRDLLNDAIKLMLFPYSLEGAARIWDNVSKTDDRIDKLADQISNLVEIINKQVIAPAKVVEKTCVTYGGAHAYYDCIAIDTKVSLNENCSAMLLKKLPEKLGDLSKFLIPYDFPGMEDVLDFKYNSKSSNPTSIFESNSCKEPIVKSSSPTLTPFGEIIIAKNLKDVEREALINVLKYHKRAISWKISDIKGIDPRFCTHKILMDDDYKPALQSQRRVNPKIHDVINKEVIKLFDADTIYHISDSLWVSPIHCVPKKGGMTVVTNENNKLIPMRLVTG
nr:reverse transcriptase domain-containing protein [Tanacetum cinerariifolium]